MTGDALELARRRIIVISMIAWLPLLVLSAIEKVPGQSEVIPFLNDMEVHVRFLVAMPLLIIADLVVHMRLRFVVKQFLERNLIPALAAPRFNETIVSALRLRNSTIAEVLLIALVYGVGMLLIWRHYLVLDTATWYAVSTGEGPKLSLAGVWYSYISLSLF